MDPVNRCAGCGMDVGPSPGWHTERQHAERLRILATRTQFQLLDALLAANEENKLADDISRAMNDLLGRTAVALKGPEPPLTAHDWSDLPERGEALSAQLLAANERAEKLLAIIESGRGVMCGREGPILVAATGTWNRPGDKRLSDAGLAWLREANAALAADPSPPASKSSKEGEGRGE